MSVVLTCNVSWYFHLCQWVRQKWNNEDVCWNVTHLSMTSDFVPEWGKSFQVLEGYVLSVLCYSQHNACSRGTHLSLTFIINLFSGIVFSLVNRHNNKSSHDLQCVPILAVWILSWLISSYQSDAAECRVGRTLSCSFSTAEMQWASTNPGAETMVKCNNIIRKWCILSIYNHLNIIYLFPSDTYNLYNLVFNIVCA